MMINCLSCRLPEPVLVLVEISCRCCRMSQPSQLRTSLPHRTSSSHTQTITETLKQSTPVTAALNSRQAYSPTNDKEAAVQSPQYSQPQPQTRSRSISVTSGSSGSASVPSQTQQQSNISRTAVEFVRRIVSPSSILFADQPLPAPTRQHIAGPPHRQATMDRRHPSSFQQLEKLGEGTYATVSYGVEVGWSWSADTTCRSTKDVTDRLVNSLH